MTPPHPSRPRAKPPRKATFLKAASDDVGRLAEDDRGLTTLALRKVRELEARTAEGAPLELVAVFDDEDRRVPIELGKQPAA